MKKAIALIVLLIMYFTGNSQKVFYSTLKADGIKGQVRTIERERYKTDSTTNTIVSSGQLVRMEYDEKGSLVKDGLYENTHLVYGKLTTYHPNGLIKKIEFINKDEKVTSTEEYDINEKGNYTGGRAYQDGKLHSNFKIVSQNKYGQWTRLEWYKLNGDLNRIEEFTYQDNRLIKMQWKDKDGNIKREETRTYNSKGELMETKAGGTDGRAPINSNRRNDKYDNKGNPTQYTSLKPDGMPSVIYKISYTYW